MTLRICTPGPVAGRSGSRDRRRYRRQPVATNAGGGTSCGLKIGRQHAGDDVLPPAEHHRTSDHRRVGVEPAFEEPAGRTTPSWPRRRRSTKRKAGTREIPEPVGDGGDVRLHNLVTDVDRLRSRQESRQPVEYRRLITPGDEIGRHDDVFLAALVERSDPDQALGMRIRQRPDQHRVDDAEHCRVQADPECQCEDDDGAEAGRAAQQAKSVSARPGRGDPTRSGSRPCGPLPSSTWRCRMPAWPPRTPRLAPSHGRCSLRFRGRCARGSHRPDCRGSRARAASCRPQHPRRWRARASPTSMSRWRAACVPWASGGSTSRADCSRTCRVRNRSSRA